MTLTGATRGRADPVILVAGAADYLVFMVVLIVAGSAAAIAWPGSPGSGSSRPPSWPWSRCWHRC
jgi:hypothetical protein